MGQVPTFNIEVNDITEEQARNLLNQVLPEFLNSHPDWKIEEMSPPLDDEQIEGKLLVPNQYNTTGSSAPNFHDRVSVNFLDESNEYVGNHGPGLVLQYQCWYHEEMDTLYPKIEAMRDLHELFQEKVGSTDIDSILKFHSITSTL